MIDSKNEDRKFVEKEFSRMSFDKDSRWRISDINKDFELCNTYPRFLILPFSFKDEDLDSVAKFRYFRRIPTAVWRHIKNGCFIVRSSQPTVGWFGWFRNEMDENLVQSYVNNTIQQKQANNSKISCSSDRINDNNGNYGGKNNGDAIIKDGDESDNARYARCGDITINNHDNDENCCDRIEGLNGDNNGKANYIGLDSISISVSAIDNCLKSNQEESYNDEDDDDDEEEEDNDKANAAEDQLTKNNYNHNHNHSDNSTLAPTTTNDTTNPTSRMLIIDARSYAAAMANRAKGGGCECSEYYQKCEVHFMNLANIHSIRKSYHAIRNVCEAYSEQSNNWLSFLDNSRWLHHISGLLKSALMVADAIDIEEKSIMIHCSDGWDRTPQLVALAEIMLDSHYRTFDGFRTLVQREWLDFGHKFADRCESNPCNEDPNERCPVFLQWLDCVQQLLVQYPEHFEFNSLYLDKLNRHTYSNIFGTFSYNSNQERVMSRVNERLFSLWSYFDSARYRYRNDDYVESEDILRPSFKVKDLHFWKEVYLPPINQPKNNNDKCSQDSLFIDGCK